MPPPNRVSILRVLAAVEPGSDHACIDAAHRFAAGFDASLIVTQVLPGLGEPLAPQDETRALEELTRTVQERSGRKPGSFEACIARGDPAAAIVELATRQRAYLVVVGTHGRHGLDRLVTGSVAANVLRKAPCSVLVARSSSPASGPIIAACDLALTSQPVLEVAGAAGARLGKPLIALHAVETNMSDAALVATAMFSGAVPAQPDGVAVDAMKEVAIGALRSELVAAQVEANVEVATGAATTEILARARSTGASLIVIGTHGRRGAARLILGSVSEAVVRDSPCDVLVVR